MKLEIVVIPVSDIDRAKEFYSRLGWRQDADFAGPDDYRVIQFTPLGSGRSVIFGRNVTGAAPGSAKGLYLIVSRHRGRAEGSHRARRLGRARLFTRRRWPHRQGRALPVRHTARERARPAARQLSLVRVLQRSGRQWLAVSGNHSAVARPRRYRDGFQLTCRPCRRTALRGSSLMANTRKILGKHDENWPEWYATCMCASNPVKNCRRTAPLPVRCQYQRQARCMRQPADIRFVEGPQATGIGWNLAAKNLFEHRCRRNVEASVATCGASAACH